MSLSLLTIATLTVLATLATNRLVTLTRLEEVGEQLVERGVHSNTAGLKFAFGFRTSGSGSG